MLTDTNTARLAARAYALAVAAAKCLPEQRNPDSNGEGGEDLYFLAWLLNAAAQIGSASAQPKHRTAYAKMAAESLGHFAGAAYTRNRREWRSEEHLAEAAKLAADIRAALEEEVAGC